MKALDAVIMEMSISHHTFSTHSNVTGNLCAKMTPLIIQAIATFEADGKSG